ncbi:MAG: hypothetical protein K2G69_07015 [Muribaculaceae bacterium]|nr:hypothetical protein [Muribaculaceae bacterium]
MKERERINTLANRWRWRMLRSGLLKPNSTSRPYLYDISRHWRKLLKTSKGKCKGGYDREEWEAGRIIAATIKYLKVRNPALDIDDLIESQMRDDLRM